MALFVAYLAAGYVAPRLSWVDARPAAPQLVPLPPISTRAAGALHVHTRRSHDALGDESEVARAAREAGLDFVIITDHRAEDSPDSLWRRQARYEEGVLLVSGQEISLGGGTGRLLVLGLDTALTRWDGGPEAFARLLEQRGAIAIVAHSRSPRVRDSWRPRETPGIVGWEVFDLADVARARLSGPWVAYHLLALATSVPLGRTHESLLRLYREGFSRPAVAAFDSLRARRPLTALAGLDVHPKRRIAGRLLPGYGPFFKTLVNHVELGGPSPGDPGKAATALAEGLRAGTAFISFGETESARAFTLGVVESDRRPAVGSGEHERGTITLLRAGFPNGPPPRLLYRVFRDGDPVAWVRGPELAWPLLGRGTYRLEVHRYGLRLGPIVWNLRPWIFSNPVRSGSPTSPPS